MRTAQEVSLSQRLYQSNIETAAREQYEGNVAAINEGAGIAAGGANRGAAISAGGVNKAYGLELVGTKIQFNTTKTAAGQIKDANLEASRMRESQPSLAAWPKIWTAASRKECANAIDRGR